MRPGRGRRLQQLSGSTEAADHFLCAAFIDRQTDELASDINHLPVPSSPLDRVRHLCLLCHVSPYRPRRLLSVEYESKSAKSLAMANSSWSRAGVWLATCASASGRQPGRRPKCVQTTVQVG